VRVFENFGTFGTMEQLGTMEQIWNNFGTL
jgi:hypothetical protein